MYHEYHSNESHSGALSQEGVGQNPIRLQLVLPGIEPETSLSAHNAISQVYVNLKSQPR